MSRLALAALVLLSAASLIFYLQLRTAAFPEHAIRFEVTRDEARNLAEAFLRDRIGRTVDGYTVATVFRVDDEAKTYLEKEVGVGRTSELAGEIDLWHFTSRYFRPLEKEEVQVAVSPDGRVVGYRRLIDETAPGARLDRDQALARADQVRRDLARLPGTWRLVEDVSLERRGAMPDEPGRLDWRFIWERDDLPLGANAAPGDEAGRARLQIVILGEEVGEFSQFVKVPEWWQREYSRIRSANSLVQTLATVLGLLPLVLAMLVVLVRRFGRGDLRLGTASALAMIGGALATAGILNQFPIMLASYPTTASWEAFVFQVVLTALVAGSGQALLIFVCAAAGETLYRERFPALLSLGSSVTWRGAMTRPGAIALGVGALFAAVMAAYQVGYYLAGRTVGFWTPADVQYENIFSAPAPWLYPAVIGYTAATFEEFAFRMFAIPLLMVGFARLVGRQRLATWLAIVLAAVVWAFVHSTYPQDPFFARGLEITFPGILFGWLMIRFGILASLAVHYTFNAFVTSIVLDGANDLPMSVAAYAVTAIPLLVAAIALVRSRRHGFVDHTSMLNRAETAAEVPARVAPPPYESVRWSYRPLSNTRRRLTAGIGVVGLVIVIVSRAIAPASDAFAYDRVEASRRADAAVTALGFDPGTYDRVVAVESRDDDLARTYLREQGGEEAVRSVYDGFIPAAIWQARYARVLERDEIRVRLLPDAAPDARPFAIDLDVGETTPGARLTIAEARALAEADLDARPEWSGIGRAIVDEGTRERAARTHHRFVFEQRDRRIGEAQFRAETDVVGDVVSGYHPFVKLPEQWERERTGVGFRQSAAAALATLIALVLLGLAVGTFLRLARTGPLPWRQGLAVGGGFALLTVVGEVNALPLFNQDYPTAVPYETFLASRLATSVAGVVLGGLAAAAASLLLLGVWRSLVAPAMVPAENRSTWARDAALLGVALPLGLAGVVRAVEWLEPEPILGGSTSDLLAPTGADTFVPALASVVEARAALLLAVLAGVAYLMVRQRLGRQRWAIGATLLIPATAALAAHTADEALEAMVLGVGLIALIAAAARWLLRLNLAAYAAAALVLVLAADGASLIAATDGWLFANGVAVFMLALVVPAGLLVFAGRGAADQPTR